MSIRKESGQIERCLASFDTFAQADKHDSEYYKSLSGEQRLEIALDIMAPYYEANPRFERVLRIVERSQCPVRDSWGLGV